MQSAHTGVRHEQLLEAGRDLTFFIGIEFNWLLLPAEKVRTFMRARVVVAVMVILISAAFFVASNHLGLSILSTRVFRWFAIGCFAVYAAKRKSLSVWVILGMAAGVECGYDWPSLADKCQFLMTIFLRLIKSLLAPLLFATLVVGIAGHANLKKMGRIGVKVLIYFEIVSTLALAIGFAAMGIAHAGVGAQV